MKWLWMVFLMPLLANSPNATAQASIRVAVYDGHTGKPIVDARVSLTVVRNYYARSLTATAVGDLYSLQVQQSDTLVLDGVTKSKFSWNEYKLCASGQDVRPIYPVSAILSKGLQAPNDCNRRIVAKPTPGEVVFFVTRLSFWNRYHPFTD